MRRVAKSRGAPRVVAAAHKSSDDATTNVEAEKHQPNANAIAGVAAAAAILGNTDAAMANAYDDYVKALEAQNIAPASIEVVPPGKPRGQGCARQDRARARGCQGAQGGQRGRQG